MYCFCVDNKFNIISIQKCGCTQIIKYMSQYLGIFNLHEHSFTNNYCNKHRNIHKCGASCLYSYNSKLPTYLVTRPIELRVLSYFKANYYHHKKINDNPTFEYFVNNLDSYYKFDNHHLGMISDKIKKRGKGIILLDLRDIETNLNNLFNQYNIKYTFVKDNIINSTSNNCSENYEDLSKILYKDLKFPVNNNNFFNKEIIEKIRIFYKKDLQYYINSTIIEN